jgi:hypothetical protein
VPALAVAVELWRFGHQVPGNGRVQVGETGVRGAESQRRVDERSADGHNALHGRFEVNDVPLPPLTSCDAAPVNPNFEHMK